MSISLSPLALAVIIYVHLHTLGPNPAQPLGDRSKIFQKQRRPWIYRRHLFTDIIAGRRVRAADMITIRIIGGACWLGPGNLRRRIIIIAAAALNVLVISTIFQSGGTVEKYGFWNSPDF